MVLIYFDSSALVKLLVQEEGSDLAAELWDGCDAALSSRLAYAEVCGALAAAGRNHDLSHADLDLAQQAWEQYWASVRPVELTAGVENQAGQLARTHALRGAGAVHLASALALADPDLVITSWDRRLQAGAAAAGLRVAPAQLPRADLPAPPSRRP
jgi:predicted nucleic acid-binding protein